MEPSGPQSYYSTCPPDWSAGVLYVGHEQCAPGHNWQGVRDHFLMHYVSRGEGSVRAGRRVYRLGRGDAFLYPPGVSMNYTADADDPWHYLWVGFRGIHGNDLITPLGLTATKPVLQMAYSREIETTLHEMIETLEHRDTGSGLLVTGLLYRLLGLLEQACAVDRPIRTTAADLVREARMFVQQNFQREIDVADVIRHIGIDRSHFSRVFRSSEGISLREFLIRTRMDRARRLIEETDLPMRAVAASVGYATYPSFERRYRATFGCAPSATRAARARTGQASPRS